MTQPYLYILMRSDLASLNPGKAVAQGAHAANIFSLQAESSSGELRDMYDTWRADGAGYFGTTITLHVTERQLLSLYELARTIPNTLTGVVRDTTYPLQDGATLHLIDVRTCGFVFGDKTLLEALCRQFSLMP